jgi:uncharacterized membrane protein YhaH (DUF805 family)
LLFCAVLIPLAFLVDKLEGINFATREGKILASVAGLAFIASVRAKALRLHDLELSGFIAPVVMLVPIGIIVFELHSTGMAIFGVAALLVGEIFFMSIPGGSAENRYGAETPEGSKLGLILLVMLMVATGIGIWTQ